jgi:hypothetical protein
MFGNNSGPSLVIVLTLIPQCIPALADEAACVAAYKDNVSNIAFDERDAAENAAAFHHYCRSDGSVDKSSLGANASFVVDTTPVTLGMTSGTDEEKMTRFCDIGSKSEGFTSHSTAYSKTIVIGAQENFNQCLLLSKSNISIRYTYLPPRIVTIVGSYSPGLINGTHPDAYLNRIVYDKSKVTCSSNSFHGATKSGNAKVIDDSVKQIKLDGAFSIECTRIPVKGGGKDYYPDVQISTSILAQGVPDPFTISIPAVENYGPTLSTDYENRLNELKKSADAAQTSLQVTNAKLQSDLAAANARLANAHVVDTALQIRSDLPRVGPTTATDVGCGNFDEAAARAKMNCPPPMPVTIKDFVERPVGSCDFTMRVYTCFSR